MVTVCSDCLCLLSHLPYDLPHSSKLFTLEWIIFWYKTQIHQQHSLADVLPNVLALIAII